MPCSHVDGLTMNHLLPRFTSLHLQGFSERGQHNIPALQRQFSPTHNLCPNQELFLNDLRPSVSVANSQLNINLVLLNPQAEMESQSTRHQPQSTLSL